MKRSLALVLIVCLWLPGRAQPGLSADAARERLAQGWFVLRSGDSLAGRDVYDFLAPLEHLESPPERWHVFFGPDALAPLFLDYARGHYTAVLEAAPGVRAAARARQSPSRQLEILLLALAAADNCGRADTVKQLLPEAEGLASGAPGARGALARYILYTMRAANDNERQSFSRDEARQRAEVATALLEGLTYDEDYRRNALIEPWLARDAMLFWMRRLTARRLQDPLIAQFEALYHPLLAGARQPCEADRLDQLSAYQELSTTRAEVLFEMSARAAVLGTLTREQACSLIDPALDQCEIDYAEFKKGAKNDALLLPWLRGPISRTLALGHLARASITLARLRENPGQVSDDQCGDMGDHLMRAMQVVQKIADDEARTRVQLAFLEALILARPSDWEKDVETILARMEKAWSKNPDKLFPYIIVLSLKGKVRAGQKRDAEAIEALSKAIALIEAWAQESGSTRQTMENWQEEYELLARLQLESGQTTQAVDTLDRQGQLSTITSFPLRSLQRPELRSAVELQEKMVGLTQQAGSGDANAAELLAQTRSEFYQTLADLQKKEPTYRRLTVRPNNFSRLQPALPSDTVVVQLFPAPEKLYLFVATHDALKIRSVPISASRLEELVTTFRRSVIAFGRQDGASFDWASPEGTRLGAILIELGDALWAPIEADLKEKSVVVYIPTGPLDYLPLQVLARPGTPRPRLLVEEMAVAVAAKSSDLETLQRGPGAGKTLLALADPDGSLSGARQEATDVAGLFPGSEVCVGKEATTEHLVSLKPDVAYLHFATHGLLDVVQPTDSYLLMAGDHTHLSVTEIAGLDLGPVRLVTLSACQSALADRLPEVGTELNSLADAFAFAGSPSLVASLWKVSDQSTRLLMVEFYRQLAAGKPRAQALRLAELALLARPETAHPFHWSAFELIGDWR